MDKNEIEKSEETTFEEICNCLKKNKSFVVIGGAGSGKTTILKKTIEKTLENLPQNKKILCITYTNVAVDEIKSRINNDKLYVSTFHDFFWSFIKQYQKDIKNIIIDLIKNNKIKPNIDPNGQKTNDDIINSFSDKSINYKNYTKIDEGIISHNEIILLAVEMFNKETLKNRFSNIFPYVFIDEFQDTQREIVDIFVNHTNSTIGFFGDPMQSIYDNGIGDLNDYIGQNKLQEILKCGNYRNPEIIINIINKLRITDKLEQEMFNRNKIQDSKFYLLYSNSNDVKVDYLKKYISNKYCCKDIENGKKTKILYLTHKLKASNNSYEKLYKIYKEKYKNSCNDKLFKNECKIISHLIKIQTLIKLYENNNYKEFFKLSEFKIAKKSDKTNLQLLFSENFYNKNIGDVIDYFDGKKLILKDDSLNNFILENKDFYNEIKELPYLEFINIYDEIENLNDIKSLNVTMHSIKGSEFDNIVILLNNGDWRNYNFSLIFDKTNENKNEVFIRTKKIFYVALSRTKQNCFVFVSNPDLVFINKAKEFLGEEHVEEIKPV